MSTSRLCQAPKADVVLGYKFETLSTLPKPWGETPREFIENRENHVVNNKSQYCSVVRTGIGSTTLCLGGEVDASEFSLHIFSPLFFHSEIAFARYRAVDHIFN